MTMFKVEFWRGQHYERHILAAVDDEDAVYDALEHSTLEEDEIERCQITTLPTPAVLA